MGAYLSMVIIPAPGPVPIALKKDTVNLTELPADQKKKCGPTLRITINLWLNY